MLHAATEIGNIDWLAPRQTEEDEIGIRDDRTSLRRRSSRRRRRRARVQVGDLVPGLGVAGCCHNIEFGMRPQMRNSSAPVKPGADDGDLVHERTLRPVECLCNDLHTTRTDLQRDTGELGLEILGDALSATSRPRPESFMPPNGAAADVGLTSLIPMMPNRRPSIARIAVERSLVYT